MDPFDYLLSLEKFGIKFGLENIRAICHALGDPQQQYRSLIVAGTNGKGSVTAMIDTALRAAGHRVARYTSPHLVRLEERFVIDGAAVSSHELADAVDLVRQKVDELRTRGTLAVQPTFFEVTTAVAFELFRRRRVELAVLEVGLGGRFDATNLVMPIAAAITSIDLDHETFLGQTIAEIASEKAGVVKPRSRVVVGERKPEALAAIERTCRAREAELVRAWEGVDTEVAMVTGQTRVTMRTPIRTYGPLALALPGRHQVANAVVAVRLLEGLRASGVEVPAAAVESGLRDTAWRGRLERVPLAAHRALLLDAAHNEAGAAALAAYLQECVPERLPLVFGVMRDKHADAMLARLAPAAARFVLTRARTPRAAAPADLAVLARRVAPDVPVEVSDDPWAAVECALAGASLACVAGSIFLVGDVLARLELERR